MIKILNIILILSVALFLMGCDNTKKDSINIDYNSAQNYLDDFEKKKPTSSLIDMGLAEFTALKYINLYYPNNLWGVFHNITLVGMDGKPAVHVIFLKSKKSDINTIAELEIKIMDGRKQRDKIEVNISKLENSTEYSSEIKQKMILKLRSNLRIENENIYSRGSFGHVVVGAVNTESIVLSHSKGIPVFYAVKEDYNDYIKNELSLDNTEIGRVIYLSPFDIYYELITKNTQIKSGSSLNPDSKLIKITYNKNMINADELIQQIQNNKLRKAEKNILSNSRERNWYEQGELDRYNFNIQQWESIDREYISSLKIQPIK